MPDPFDVMDQPTPISRRQLIRAAAVGAGLGALGLGRVAQQISASGHSVPRIEGAGTALQPAERFGPAEPTQPPEPEYPPAPDGMLIFPLDAVSDCYVLDNFGDCRSGCSRLHEGVDIMGSRDQPVRAVADGVLVNRNEDRGLTYGAGNGWTLYDEENARSYKYYHLSSHEPGLEEGDEVRLGDVIGYVGNTGTSGAHNDFNYHLHFEVRNVVGSSHWDSVAIDPLPLLVVPDDMCGVSPPIRA